MSLTAGVIGCGNIAQYHFSGLEKAGARIKWVCDINPDAAKPWMEKYSAKFTKDYKEIMADKEVDVVNVTTISSAHLAICTDAIKAGKHVICEKTLAENAEDAKAIVEMAKKANVNLYTNYMKRFIPAVEKAKEIVPTLGKIFDMYIRSYQNWGTRWKNPPPESWFYTPPGGMSILRQKYGGGILHCGGSHMLDLVVFLLGRPKSLYANMFIPEGRDYDIHTSAFMEGDNGSIHFDTWAHALGRTVGFLRDSWDEKVEINGELGRIEIYSSVWTDHTSKSSVLIHHDATTQQTHTYDFAPVSPFDRGIAFFCENIQKGTQGSQSKQTGYDVDRLISTIQESSAKRKAIEIPW